MRSFKQLSAVVAVMVWLLILRPVSLGGPATYVIVSGVSMLPALEDGDLVLALAAESYDVGDVVAFRAGDGVVIHRIVGGDAVDGYVVQGDNRDQPDLWRPTPATILGSLRVAVPGVGPLARSLGRPPLPAAVAAVLTFVLLAGGRRGRAAAGTTAAP